MALDANQLADMQGDLGITDDESVFTDTELNRLYDRAGSDYNTAVYLGFRQLMADASKFFTYSAGQTKVEKAQLFEHVKAMVEFWKAESRTAANQVRILGLNEVPPRHKDEPSDSDYNRLRRRSLNVPD